ncbi:hypothetical protein V1281_004100 [Nitrobacteraceae bacterium AZCC 2161]
MRAWRNHVNGSTPQARQVIRAEILMSLNDLGGVDKDLQKIDDLLEKSGGLSEGDEIKFHELQARYLIERRQLRQAMTKIDNSVFLTKPMKRRLLEQLASIIKVGGEALADKQLISWAKSYAS